MRASISSIASMRLIKRCLPVRPWPPEAIEKPIVLPFHDSEALERTVNDQRENMAARLILDAGPDQTEPITIELDPPARLVRQREVAVIWQRLLNEDVAKNRYDLVGSRAHH